ncbi:hypothetical protein ACIQUQ_26075 [Streptomyces sp. NPDC101118]|uniref:hypothetical protein n=1 Tax=Streptomyces sp. NPDC101118 TaxID=3366109 RepID=UPI00380F6001
MAVGADFLRRYEQAQIAAGRGGGDSALRHLTSWKRFVEACAEGYDDVISEYFEDLRVRDAIECGLAEKSLRELAGYEEFSRAVQAVDARFREIATVVGSG